MDCNEVRRNEENKPRAQGDACLAASGTCFDGDLAGLGGTQTYADCRARADGCGVPERHRSLNTSGPRGAGKLVPCAERFHSSMLREKLLETWGKRFI